VSVSGANKYHSLLGYDAVWMVCKYKLLEVLATFFFNLQGRNFDYPENGKGWTE
jgi:hypothetical protein